MITREQIEQAKEELGDRNFELIMEAMGVQDYDEVKRKCLCPVHKEDTASMVFDSKRFVVHCFGCQASYDLISARIEFQHETFKQAAEFLLNAADIPYDKTVDKPHEYRFPHEEGEIGEPVINYLKMRGISEETARKYGVQQDAEGNMVFVYRNRDDVPLTVKYRPSHKVSKGSAKTWCQKDADHTALLFGMNLANPSEPLVITEGECDCMAAAEAGVHNVVSIPLGAGNCQWIDQCFDFLEQFTTITLVFDNDEAGRKATTEVSHRLGTWRCKVANVPNSVQVAGQEQSQKVKDINEVLYYAGKEEVARIIAQASECEIENVMDLSDIADVDIEDLEVIRTGFLPIDSAIRGLYCGSVVLWSGLPSSGKSSMMSQIACNLADNGIPVMLYSGEMSGTLVKQWHSSIFAGAANMNRIREETTGAVYYKVTPAAREKINEYYRGFIYVYDNDSPNDPNTILQTAENLIRRKGVKFVMLDNLAIMDIKADDANAAQTALMNDLLRMARKYNIVIILCAHPRKLQYGETEITLHSVAGTANLSNLAHLMFAMRRVTDVEKQGILNRTGDAYVQEPISYDVVVTLLKDRLSGFSGKKFGFYYDKQSRRFFWDEKSFAHNYGWSGGDARYDNAAVEYPVVSNVDLAFDR